MAANPEGDEELDMEGLDIDNDFELEKIKIKKSTDRVELSPRDPPKASKQTEKKKAEVQKPTLKQF